MVRGIFFAIFFVSLFCSAQTMPAVDRISLPGAYRGHLQSFCVDGAGHIFWSQTHELIKTDFSGNILSSVAVTNNHGGLTFADGKIFAAVSLPGQAKLSRYNITLRAYSPEDLSLLEVISLAQDDRAGAVCATPFGFAIGCMRGKNLSPFEVRCHFYDRKFNWLSSRNLECERIKLGVENIVRSGGSYWLAMYSFGKGFLVEYDEEFRERRRFRAEGSSGVLPEGEWIWFGRTWRNKEGLWQSCLVREKISALEEIASIQRPCVSSLGVCPILREGKNGNLFNVVKLPPRVTERTLPSASNLFAYVSYDLAAIKAARSLDTQATLFFYSSDFDKALESSAEITGVFTIISPISQLTYSKVRAANLRGVRVAAAEVTSAVQYSRAVDCGCDFVFEPENRQKIEAWRKENLP